MRKKSALVLMALLILVSGFFVIKYIFIDYERHYYESFWDISLPKSMELTYKKVDQGGFQGDGTRYAQFQLLEADSDYLDALSTDRNDELEKIFQTFYYENGIVSYVRVDFESPYYWIIYIKNSQDYLYTVYSPSISRVFLLQITG